MQMYFKLKNRKVSVSWERDVVVYAIIFPFSRKHDSDIKKHLY